ncbi:SCO6745 family protein [Actinacidiphila alni]|uniref:SCO6745 family protein n=1 Tax=Actinacidiphila alni TaxID=380248 RepID=UPI003451790F
MTLLAGRKCFRLLEPLHSMVYFAPETQAELTAAGLEKSRMCYFAGRAAALGPVGAAVVASTFYNFNPALVARHIPRAWTMATPEAITAARLRAVDAVQHRLLGAAADAPEMAEAAGLALRATEACTGAGRPLYAAHAELPRPEQPHLAFWHATTLLREYRGDGHLAVLLSAELDGLEALVTHTATGKGFLPDFARASRGWSEQEWDAASERLRERGVLDAAGTLTEAGVELRRQIESETDRLGRAPYEHLGEEGTARLTELAQGLTMRALGAGAFPAGVFAMGTMR